MKKIFLLILLFSRLVHAAEYGVFMVVKGKVRIESSGTSVEAKISSKIQVGDTVITESDSRAKIVMTDRNIINISPNSKLKIEKYTNNSSDKNVNLNLIEGKVRTNVEQKYDNKNSKFEIRTATAVAGVRGTQFITSYDKMTKITEVVTLKGQVSFQSLSSGGKTAPTDPVVVNKGEKSQAKDGSAPAVPIKVPEKEIKQMDSDSSVKKDKPQDRGGPQAPSTAAQGEVPGGGDRPVPTGTPLVDMNSGNTQIKDGAANRKFENSKVKIITQPSP